MPSQTIASDPMKIPPSSACSCGRRMCHITSPATAAGDVADLLRPKGTGPLWGMASSDFNATLLVWPADHEVAEHTNTELDVLLIVLEGGGTAVIDEQEHALSAG